MILIYIKVETTFCYQIFVSIKRKIDGIQCHKITIRDGVVRLCTLEGKYHTLNMTLEEVESQLDPQRFMRANRQFIISAA